MRTIPFKILKTIQSYNSGGEGVTVEEKDETIEISIRKQFDTPGYFMNVDKIVEEDHDNYSIYLHIIPPESDSILLQIITYKTIILEIAKKDLMDLRFYSFKVKDHMNLNLISGKGDIKEC